MLYCFGGVSTLTSDDASASWMQSSTWYPADFSYFGSGTALNGEIGEWNYLAAVLDIFLESSLIFCNAGVVKGDPIEKVFVRWFLFGCKFSASSIGDGFSYLG